MVTKWLRRWFVIHFVLDVAAALPLFIAPAQLLGSLGWPAVDPIATRLVAAALFGIGIESYLGRKAGVEAFRGMLNLKIIWSASATLGTLWSQLQGGPTAGWAVFAIFAAFNVLWVRYRIALRSAPTDSSGDGRDAPVRGAMERALSHADATRQEAVRAVLSGRAASGSCVAIRDHQPVAVDEPGATAEQVFEGGGAREEVKMVIDRVAVVALARDDDDQPLRDAT